MLSNSDLSGSTTGMADGQDEDPLTSTLYNKLHSMARKFMRLERPGHQLQTTDLIHEAYIRLGELNDTLCHDRYQYLRLAARAMRRILIDYSRYYHSLKREEGFNATSYEDNCMITEKPTGDILALDAALNRLSSIDPRIVEIVELRFFGGMTIQETSHVLGISPSTVKREWRVAKAWFRHEMGRKRAKTPE